MAQDRSFRVEGFDSCTFIINDGDGNTHSVSYKCAVCEHQAQRTPDDTDNPADRTHLVCSECDKLTPHYKPHAFPHD